MTNKQRAERAARTLVTYRKLVGESDPSAEEDVTDLLADLRHFCDVIGRDFDALNDRAFGHYMAEVHKNGDTPCQ
ncbi:MAG: hypothetical protein AAFQ99_11825 [Pseudomonadota bacterium]